MYKKKKKTKLTLIEYTCVFFNVLSKIFIFIYVKKALTKCAFVSNVRTFFLPEIVRHVICV